MPDDNDLTFSEDVFKTVEVLEHVLKQCSGDPNVDLNALLMMVASFGLHQIHEFDMERQAYIDMVVKQINHLMDNAVIVRDASTLN